MFWLLWRFININLGSVAVRRIDTSFAAAARGRGRSVWSSCSQVIFFTQSRHGALRDTPERLRMWSHWSSMCQAVPLRLTKISGGLVDLWARPAAGGCAQNQTAVEQQPSNPDIRQSSATKNARKNNSELLSGTPEAAMLLSNALFLYFELQNCRPARFIEPVFQLLPLLSC